MIAHWAYCRPDGVVHSYTSQQAGVEPAPMGDLLLVQLDAPYPGEPGKKVDISTGVVVSYQPPSPGDNAVQTWAWDEAATDWVASPTLLKRKTDAWARIKTARERRLSAGITVAGRHYQVNQTALSGATLGAFMALVQRGNTAADYRQVWVLSDNSVVSLTAPEMIAVGQACKALFDGLWATSQYLRGLIDAATTPEQVDAVTWP